MSVNSNRQWSLTVQPLQMAIPPEVLLSTLGPTFVTQDAKCEVARPSNSSQNLFIGYCFHEYANIRVTEQSQHRIPNVVFKEFYLDLER